MRIEQEIEVYVTAEDIKYGNPKDCELCAVALALDEVFPGEEISVMGPQIFITTDDYHLQYHAPREVVEFMDNFDNQQPVQPFTFKAKLESFSDRYRPIKDKQSGW